MKAGSISPAAEQVQIVPGAKMQGNVDSFSETKTGSFQMYFTANAGKGQEIDFASVTSGGNNVNAAGGQSVKEFSKLQDSTVKDKITGDTGKTDGSANAGKTDKDKAVSEAENRISDAVKKELGLTDEELEAALAELGLCAADLVMPQNVALLVASVNGTDVTSVVADSALTEQLTNLMAEINAVVADVAGQLDLEPEQFAQMLEQSASDDDKDAGIKYGMNEEQEPKQTVVSVVKEESTGKEIKVTLENSKVTDSETTLQSTKISENAQDSSGSQQDRKQNGFGQRNENGFANGLVQNLTQAVAERTEGIQSFAESYTVNASDVIHQLIEAVRVNVNAATTSMELQLNPENLGKINLNVVTREGMVTATITAQNEAVKAIIESQLVQLKESLNNQGLKVQSVEVAVANHGFNLGENNEGQEQSNNQTTRGRRHSVNFEEPPEEDEDMSEVLRQRIMKADGNSVNYTA